MSKQERSSRGGPHDRHRHDRHGHDHHEQSDRDRVRERRRRHRSPSYDSYESDSYDSESSRDPSPPRRSSRKHAAYSDSEDRQYRRGRDRERRDRYRDDEDRSPSPEKRSIVEDLLAAIGLIQSKHGFSGSSGRDRSRSGRDDEGGRKSPRQALQAALTAAAMEAWRTRKEGKLTPQRLMQIAAAAIAAGGLDALIDRNSHSGGTRRLIESVAAGLATGNTMGKIGVGDRNKLKPGGLVGMAARELLTRSLSSGGPERRRTNRF